MLLAYKINNMRASRALAFLALLLFAPGTAVAKRAIAVLAFGGTNAEKIRSSLTRPLRHKYEVVDGQELLDACDSLGITMTRGRNLAKAARHVGAVAVIGGAISRGYLSIAVYSGKTGQPIATGRVPCRRRLKRKSLRKALGIILKGMRKAPKRVGRRRRRRPPAPAPTPTPAPAPTPAPREKPSENNLTFDPEPITSSDASQVDDASYENPLAAEENPLAPKGPQGPTFDQPPPAEVTKTPEEDTHGTPKVEATVGIGTWMRSLEINQPDIYNPAPKYSSGAAFALGVGFKIRPIAFFTDGLASSFYSRFHFQTMLGLESKNNDQVFGTSLWEIRWEVVGFDWNIMSKPTSPHLEGGIGFGLMSFAIDWGEAPDHAMPNASYQHFLIALGGHIPVTKQLKGDLDIGVHLRFDYRVVTQTGEIEDEQSWYGPSSTGGINGLIGISANYKGIVGRLEYSYTRYFYSFTDAQVRLDSSAAACSVDPNSPDCKRAAGGALDQLHGIILSGGYSF